jgi:hypothetical protein
MVIPPCLGRQSLVSIIQGVPREGKDDICIGEAIRDASYTLQVKIYKTIILPVYGCETWSFTIREEPRLRMFKNRVMRRIFGSKMDYVTGEWSKLYTEELIIVIAVSSFMSVPGTL